MKKYIVRLTQEERKELEHLRKKARIQTYKRTRAQILLLADQGVNGPAWIDEKSPRPSASANVPWNTCDNN